MTQASIHPIQDFNQLYDLVVLTVSELFYSHEKFQLRLFTYWEQPTCCMSNAQHLFLVSGHGLACEQ